MLIRTITQKVAVYTEAPDTVLRTPRDIYHSHYSHYTFGELNPNVLIPSYQAKAVIIKIMFLCIILY